MYLAVLRASSASGDPAELLARHRVSADGAWKPGDVYGPGYVMTTAGFSVTMADEGSHDELLASVRSWLSTHQSFLDDLSACEAECIVDLGVSVTSDRPARSVVVPADVLGALAKAGITLELSAYLSAVE